MKKKSIFSTVLSIIVITMMMWTSVQAQCTFQLTPNMAGTIVTVNKCITNCSQVVFYRPMGTYTNVNWQIFYPTPHDLVGDSIILDSSNAFGWVSNQFTIMIHFYLVDNPTNPGFAITSTSCGTLDAGINPGGTFAWNTGAISQTISVTTPGTYLVEKSNTCGSVSDTTEILWGSSPVNIGSDTTLCYGLSLPLDAIGGSSWLWSNGTLTQTTIVDTTGIYWVAATENGCTLYDSLEANFTINTGEEIFYATTDTITGNNEIRWTDLKPNMVSTLIYRADTTNYNLQAIVGYNQQIFVDTLSSIQRPYRYKISTLGECNNESPKSLYHETISLAVVPLIPNGFRLEWTPYSIEGQFKLFAVSYYSIYSTNGYGGSWNPTPITTVGPNITQINLPNSLDTFYGIEGGITSSKSIISVRSNLVNNPTITGIKDILDFTPSIYPNPVENFLYIAGIPDIKHIEIYDIQGKMVYSETYNQSRLNLPNLETGSYVCIISTGKCLYTAKFQRK